MQDGALHDLVTTTDAMFSPGLGCHLAEGQHYANEPSYTQLTSRKLFGSHNMQVFVGLSFVIKTLQYMH